MTLETRKSPNLGFFDGLAVVLASQSQDFEVWLQKGKVVYYKLRTQGQEATPALPNCPFDG